MQTFVVKIDASEMTDWKTFHATFKKELGFSDFYGANMNAWIDCMTYVDDLDDCTTKIKISADQMLVLEISGVDAFKQRCPSQYDALLKGCAFVNFRRTQSNERPILALSLIT